MSILTRNASGHPVLTHDWFFQQYTREDLAAFDTLPLHFLHTLLALLEKHITRNLARECADPDKRWDEALAAAATHPLVGRLAGHQLCMNFDLLRIIVLKKEKEEIDQLLGRAA